MVNATASAMRLATASRPLVRVVEDRRGWEIHAVVAEEELHHARKLLDVAKAHIGETCQASKQVQLLCSRRPWTNVQCGFRALIGCMKDKLNVCTDVCDFGECRNQETCSKTHPRPIKRLFVVVKSSEANPKDHCRASLCESRTSTSNAQSEQFALSGTSSLNSHLGHSWSAVSHSGSVFLLGSNSVQAELSAVSEVSRSRPLLQSPAHPPHLHLSYEADPEHSSTIEARLKSGFLISL